MQGMKAASSKMSDAASHIAQMSTASVSGDNVEMGVVDGVGGANSTAASSSDLELRFNELRMADKAYQANLSSLDAADAQFEQALNMALPEGYSRLVSDS